MKLKQWPNRLGFDLETGAGAWEFVRPDVGNGQVWRAKYFPRESYYATQSGTGTCASAAMLAAITGVQNPTGAPVFSDCKTPDDALACAPEYEECAATLAAMEAAAA